MGEAFVWMYRIETACKFQIEAMAGGTALNTLSKETQRRTIQQGLKMYGEGGFIQDGLEWPALLRQIDRAGGSAYRVRGDGSAVTPPGRRPDERRRGNEGFS